MLLPLELPISSDNDKYCFFCFSFNIGLGGKIGLPLFVLLLLTAIGVGIEGIAVCAALDDFLDLGGGGTGGGDAEIDPANRCGVCKT